METHKKYEEQTDNAENQDQVLVLNKLQQNLKQSNQAELTGLQVYIMFNRPGVAEAVLKNPAYGRY